MMEWITWALQGLIGFLLLVVWQKLDENNKAINALALKMSDQYSKKEDIDQLYERLRCREVWKAGEQALRSTKG